MLENVSDRVEGAAILFVEGCHILICTTRAKTTKRSITFLTDENEIMDKIMKYTMFRFKFGEI